MNDYPNNPSERKNGSLEIEDNNDLNRHISECRKRVFDWSEFDELVEHINSDDQFRRFSGLIGVRKLLYKDQPRESEVQKIIDAGLVSKFVEFLQRDDEPQLQMEVAWILTCITYGGTSDQAKEIVDQGAIPILIRLLKSCHVELVKDTAITIRNIATHPPYRDLFLDHGALHSLIDIVNKALANKDQALLKEVMETLSGLCRGRPLSAYEKIADTIPVFCSVIQEITTIDTISAALWALIWLLVGNNYTTNVTKILEADVIPSLVRYLDYTEDGVMMPALKILGCITCASGDQVDALLKVPSTKSYVKKLFKLLKQKSDQGDTRQEIIRWDICKSLSNITNRTSDYIDLVMGYPEYIEQLINVVHCDVLKVQKGAASVLSNTTKHADKNQMTTMTRNGVFDCLYKWYQKRDLTDDMAIIGIKGIERFLIFGALMSKKEATNNKYLIKMKQRGALNKIKKLKGGQNSEVSELTLEIWKNFVKVPILRRKLRLQKAIICFRNEKHSLYGLFRNKKKRLSV